MGKIKPSPPVPVILVILVILLVYLVEKLVSKLALQNLYKRLCELGNVPSGAVRSKNRTYRTGFQRSMGAIFFLFIFFAIASRKLAGVRASSNNNGIYVLIILGVMVAALGAFFAPRIAAYLYSHSVAGRRHQASKSLHRSHRRTQHSASSSSPTSSSSASRSSSSNRAKAPSSENPD